MTLNSIAISLVLLAAQVNHNRYESLIRDNRPRDLTQEEYRFIRKHIPSGDPLRNLFARELEAIDPWYRRNSSNSKGYDQ